MALRPDPCDPRRLDLFLHRRLAPGMQREVETHVLGCPACLCKLDELAGGARWWTEVRRYLGGDGAAESARTSIEPGEGAVDLSFLQSSPHAGSLGRLGDYEVLEVLGRGGMGVVLRAFDPALHRPVAIKVLAAEFAANGAARKRFVREAQATAAVTHDHVVSVHAVDAAAARPYLVMSLIPGQSLQERIDREGPLELKEILRIGMQTASGLAAAHAQGLVHRDIKPANIMLENGIERVRITDFGLARAVDDASVTLSGAVAGTPQFMAPEQARGDPIDQRADLFSLGSTIYTMCTGRPPFRGDSAMAVIRQVCDVEPPSLRSINPDVPVWLEGIIRKLHAKDPAKRIESAAETAYLLERCLAHVQQPDRNPLPAVAQELGGEAHRAHRTAGTGWLRRFAVVAAVIALAGVAVGWWLKSGGTPPADPGRVGPSGATLASTLALEASLVDREERLRARIREMQDKLLQPSSSSRGIAGPDAADLSRRALALRYEWAASDDLPTDPIASGLAAVRRRLEALSEWRSLQELSQQLPEQSTQKPRAAPATTDRPR
jgi:hypothetical protein